MSLLLSGAAPNAVDEEAADRLRIQAHLQAVEARLRSVDTQHLPPALTEARAINLDRLHEYWQRGEFPRNPRSDGERVPYFIDAEDRLCAVGYLVVQSGFEAVAREIQATENNAKLLEMNHPALPEWIAGSGLTAQECAAIQPSYCGCPDDYDPVCGADGNTYANTCYAETCANVEVEHEGACEGDTDTDNGWPPAGTSTGEAGSTGEPGSTGEATDDGVAAGSSESTDSGSSSSDDDADEPAAKRGCSVGVPIGQSAALWSCLLLLGWRRRR